MVIAFGAALALTACVNNEMVDDAAPKEVSFKSFNLGESTRADFEGTSFMVYAQFSNNGLGTDYINFWGNAAKEITKQTVDGNDVWKVNETTKYYWPKAGAVSFWGYYPATQANVSFDNVNGVKVANVTAAQAAELMLADPTQSDFLTANTVPMVFKHAGAQVIFRFANEDYSAVEKQGFELTINSVSISNVMPQGNYQWDSWSGWSGDKVTLSNTTATDITNTTIGTTDVYTFNVVPQPLDAAGAGKVITIAYTVYDKFADYSYNATATLDATEWVKNTKHYYNVTFNFTVGEEIKFAPSVTEWSTPAAEEDYDVVG